MATISSINTINNLHDASFSSYLNRKKVEDGEIDVFSADKYFNGGNEEKNPKISNLGARKYRTEQVEIQPRTPSNQSESSWNSQSLLLRPQLQRNSSRSNNGEKVEKKKKKKKKKRLFMSCSCCDKKSVDIDEAVEIKDKTLMGVKKKIEFEDHDEEEDEEKMTRKSLEVFGSSEFGNARKSFSLERRLSMLSWDAIPRSSSSMEINTSGPPDTESDASSDLFEIECLSCTANPVLLDPRHATLDGGYEPSEVSIEWSVVTASAADSEDQRSTNATKPASSKSKDLPKPRSGILSGCRSQKSVKVAGGIHRTPKYKKDPLMTPMTRFQAEAIKVGGLGSGLGHIQRQDSSLARSPRWSHSSHASELLYI